MDQDSRGVLRGKCNNCDCKGFQAESRLAAAKVSWACQSCGCPPGQHVKAGDFNIGGKSEAIAGSINYDDDDNWDSDSSDMIGYLADGAHDSSISQSDFTAPPLHSDTSLLPAILQSASIQPSGSGISNKCAIEECSNPRHVDPSGTVHECCGYTHAMELIRRKVLGQLNQSNIVKGVTHCLLPECNKLTWPFENYCGRAHAEEGKKRRLVPPKNSSQCELPECVKPKHNEGEKVFDFCGKSHAHEAKKRGIKIKNAPTGPKTSEMCILDGCYQLKNKDSDGTVHPYCSKAHAELASSNANGQSVSKDDSMCIIPECTRPKHKDPKTGDEYDCCGKSHAEEAKKRNMGPILTSKNNVEKFLAKFSNLSVVKMEENEHAKVGGVLYKKFIAARESLPQSNQNMCLAFHGTSESNIPSICAYGYDPSRRSSQAYGPGEYFATTPNTPLGYCSGGKKLLLNELLLGQVGIHHTQHGDVIVMKKSDHDLPRFVITFQ